MTLFELLLFVKNWRNHTIAIKTTISYEEILTANSFLRLCWPSCCGSAFRAWCNNDTPLLQSIVIMCNISLIQITTFYIILCLFIFSDSQWNYVKHPRWCSACVISRMLFKHICLLGGKVSHLNENITLKCHTGLFKCINSAFIIFNLVNPECRWRGGVGWCDFLRASCLLP